MPVSANFRNLTFPKLFLTCASLLTAFPQRAYSQREGTQREQA